MTLSNQKKSVIVLLTILLILIGMIVYIAISLKTDPVKEKLQNDSVVKVLFVLSDEEGDAIATHVFFYYPLTERGEVFTIPGNTGAIYQSIGRTDRIDAVYREKGISVYNNEIQKLLGMEIPFTIDISLKSLGELTDLLGGLNIFIPSPIEIEDSVSGEKMLLPSGAVKLDGDKIQTYVLYKLNEEEFDSETVLNRKDNYFVSLLSAINEKKNVVMDKQYFSVYAAKFSANVDKDGLNTLLGEIANINCESLMPKTVTGLIRNVDGQRLLFPLYNGEFIKDVVKTSVASLLSKNAVSANRTYAIEIQNGTTTQGLARNTGVILQGAGYDVIEAKNAGSNDIEHTMIINHIGDEIAVQSLADFIHCSYIVEEEVKSVSEGLDTVGDVDFTIILGKDFDGRYVRGNYKPSEE